MLLFKPEHVALILAGIKTETRRVWKKQRIKVGSIQLAKTKMVSKDHFAKLHILEVKTQKLGQISDLEVRREGYNTLAEYQLAWERINRIPWDPMQDVYVVSFELVR